MAPARNRFLPWLCAVAAAGLFAVAPANAAPKAFDYVALGDSVASGHGLSDRGGKCRRSAAAYPRTVLAELRKRSKRVRFVMLACSGAAARGNEEKLGSLRSQVSAALKRLSRRPALVTVTIGINDFAWADIVQTYLRLRDPDRVAFDAWVEETAESVRRAVARQLKRLLARPKVRVVITDYPNPVNPGSILFGDPLPCADVALCYARTEAVVHGLRDALATLAGKRVRLAAVHEAFHGHEAPSPECGSGAPDVDDTWFQYPSDPDSNSFPPLPFGFESEWRGDCFHPNAAGADAIAQAVDRAARSLRR